jgi:gas vesicle protein
MPAADRAARRAALDALYVMAKTSTTDRKTISGLQSALKSTRENWKKEADKKDGVKIPEDVQKQAEELQKKVDDLARKFKRDQEGLGNAGPPFEWRPAPLPDQVQTLMESIDEFSAAPSPQQAEKLEELKPLVSDASAQVKKLMEQDLPALNKKMNEAGIPHIVLSPETLTPTGDDQGEESDR